MPLDAIAVVPPNINCDSVGYWYAEYQISAYCTIPALDDFTNTLNAGLAALGKIVPIVGA